MKTALVILSLLFTTNIMAQATDIPASNLPVDVKNVLDEYVNILRNSVSLEECAQSFTQIAGGGLINKSVTDISLRSSTRDYSLKKDFGNIKFYANPVQITRVNYSSAKTTSGFGESAITGRIYKIWIAKTSSDNGLPAPISIMVPEGHPSIKTPKIISIGSL